MKVANHEGTACQEGKLDQFISTDVAGRSLRPCDPALVGGNRIASHIGAVVCGAQRNGVQGGADWQQRDGLGRTAVVLQAARIEPGRCAVQVAGRRA